MRKVTKDITEALKQGKRAKSGNTRTDGEYMFLHGHGIARVDREHQEMYITLAGYRTATTVERLNGLMDTMNMPVRLSREEGTVWMRYDSGMVIPMKPSEWYRVKYYPPIGD